MRTTLTKILATVIASAVFLIMGAGALHFTVIPPRYDKPTDMPDKHTMPGVERSKSIGELPHPPYSSETYNETFKNGQIVIYETHLTSEGIGEFYGAEFSRLGWEQRELPEAAADYYPEESELTMYFTNGVGSCIINVEVQDSYTSIITMIKTLP